MNQMSHHSNIDYIELYRQCKNLDHYIELVIEEGGTEEEAVTFYHEITYKYSDQ